MIASRETRDGDFVAALRRRRCSARRRSSAAAANARTHARAEHALRMLQCFCFCAALEYDGAWRSMEWEAVQVVRACCAATL